MGRIKPLEEVRRPEWARDINTDQYMEEERERMTEAAKEARRQYKREWNRKNRDKVRAAQERYWNKRAAAQNQTDTTQEDTAAP